MPKGPTLNLPGADRALPALLVQLAPRASGRRPGIDADRCTGCGRCVAACDLHLLSLEVVHWRKFTVLHESDLCNGCSECAATCPFHAITMRTQAIAVALGAG